MTLPVWPVSLPQQPLRQSYSSRPLFRPIETEMEDGPTVARRQSVIVAVVEPVSFWMSSTQFQTFLAFFRTDLRGGASRFTMPYRDGGGGAVARTVRMTAEGYEAAPSGLGWRVSFTREVFLG